MAGAATDGGAATDATQKQVGAALVELTAQPAIGDVELEERMTGRQRHPLDFADVPGRHDDAPGIGIGAQQIQRRADLVDVLTGWSRPRSPLYTVDRPEFACITCPFVPDGDSVLVQPTDIGIAAQKPQQLVSRQADFMASGAEVVGSLEEALTSPETWVIGGGQVYALALPYATRCEVTEVDIGLPREAGDALAPVLDETWRGETGEWRFSRSGLRYRLYSYHRS